MQNLENNCSALGLTADEFAKRILEEEKLALIPCTAFGASNYIRLSYACSGENISETVKRLKRFYKGELNATAIHLHTDL